MTLSTISIPTKIRLYNVYFDTINFRVYVVIMFFLFQENSSS